MTRTIHLFISPFTSLAPPISLLRPHRTGVTLMDYRRNMDMGALKGDVVCLSIWSANVTMT